MKHTITIAAILMATTATADGPGAPRYDPPVIAPPESTWTGPYAGVSAGYAETTTRRTATETITEIPETKVPVTDQCAFTADHGPNGNGAKCWIPSDEVAAAFGHIERCNGYTKTCVMTVGKPAPGSEGQTRVFVAGDYRKGDVLTFNTGKTVIEYGEPIITVLSYMFEEVSDQGTIGAHAGYRWDMGAAVVGIEGGATYLTDTDSALGTVEATVGYDMGRLLPYVSAGAAYDGNEWGKAVGIGAEYAMTDRVALGIKASRIDIDGDVTDGLAARVSFRF